MNNQTKIEYRIIGRFRKDEKFHVVDFNRKWTFDDAMHRLKELQLKSKREIENKSRSVQTCGSIGISTPYYSEYDLLDLKIQTREITPWSDYQSELS